MPIQIALLGLGSIGMRHARNFMAQNCPVIGFDPNPARRKILSDEGGTAVEDRTQALLNADAAVIASPNNCHLDDLQAALSANCHVLAEKPLAHTCDGLAEILKTAEATGLIIACGFNLRFNPVVIKLREMIVEGDLGEILWGRLAYSGYLPSWRTDSDHRSNYTADPVTGGVIMDVIHELDLANNLLGPADVVGAASRCSGTLGIASQDIANILLRHDNGVISGIHLDYATPHIYRQTQIGGTKGAAVIDLVARTLILRDLNGEKEILRDSRLGDVDYVAETKNFLACIAGTAQPGSTGWDGLAALKQAVEARRISALKPIKANT